MFRLLDKNIMAHIDAGVTKTEYLVEEIKNNFDNFDLRLIEKIYLVIGPWCEIKCYSEKKCDCISIDIAKTLKNLGLLDKLEILEKEEANMSWETEVWFNGEIIIK